MAVVPFEYAVEDYPLAPMTLYRVGGPAKLALIPRTVDEALEAYAWMCTQDAPRMILGGGSNVLIADEGYPGIVLFTNKLDAITPLGDGRYVVEGGAVLDRLVTEVLVANNYHGTGGLTGIPGSVGGGIFMNAGTVNGSICELMESVDVVTEAGLHRIPMEPSLYGYRGQRFCPPGGLILRGHFRFTAALDDQQAIYAHYIQRRKEKQPQGYCCGSVFKNPQGDHAGRLIEACGLKGARRGDAVISEMHANFIMNLGAASSADLHALITQAKDAVRAKFGVELEEEVKLIGL